MIDEHRQYETIQDSLTREKTDVQAILRMWRLGLMGKYGTSTEYPEKTMNVTTTIKIPTNTHHYKFTKNDKSTVQSSVTRFHPFEDQSIA